MVKNNKKKEKINHDRTKEERLIEIIKVMKQFRELGFPTETPGIQEFKKIADIYLQTGESQTGRILMQEYNREIQYILTNNNIKQCTVVLKYRDLW